VQVSQHQPRADVEPGERLVKQKQLGIVQQRCRQQHFLPHPLGVTGNGRVPVCVQGEQVQQAVNARGCPTISRYSKPLKCV
jgi:hypothetical protein